MNDVTTEQIQLIHPDYPTGNVLDNFYLEHARRVRDFYTPPVGLIPTDEQIWDVINLTSTSTAQFCQRLRDLFQEAWQAPFEHTSGTGKEDE